MSWERPVNEDLPGYEVVARGIEDQAKGLMSAERLVLQCFSRRLGAVGIQVTPADGDGELALYRWLMVHHPEDTHARFKAMDERLQSFLNAAEGRRLRRR